MKDKLPDHNQIVLVFSYITSSGKNGYGNESVDVKKHPYYFVSQEVKQHTYKHVTHWMPFPEPPNE